MYIKMAWRGPEKQQRARDASNLFAKDWHDEVLKVIEHAMEDYWDDGQAQSTTACTPTLFPSAMDAPSMLISEFHCHHCEPIQQKNHVDGHGWRAELHHYLSNLPSDVSKDTNIVKWWADHAEVYPTLAHIAKDICAIPATSVPCKHLFSAGAEIATNHHSHLGAEKFEKLQIIKHAWQDNIEDQVAINSLDIKEMSMKEFKELWACDLEMNQLAEHGETMIV